MKKIIAAAFLLLIISSINAKKNRARDLGIPFDGIPGKFNAITDVKGVEVGYSTIISGPGGRRVYHKCYGRRRNNGRC